MRINTFIMSKNNKKTISEIAVNSKNENSINLPVGFYDETANVNINDYYLMKDLSDSVGSDRCADFKVAWNATERKLWIVDNLDKKAEEFLNLLDKDLWEIDYIEDDDIYFRNVRMSERLPKFIFKVIQNLNINDHCVVREKGLLIDGEKLERMSNPLSIDPKTISIEALFSNAPKYVNDWDGWTCLSTKDAVKLLDKALQA